MISAQKRNISITLGAALWFTAAMIVHFLPQLMDGGIGTLIMFAVSIPNALITIWLFEKLVKPIPGELLPSMTWGMLTALILDGIAISFAPGIYAGVSTATQYGAALIMFGAGVILLLTILRSK
jgi:hypothetical protein